MKMSNDKIQNPNEIQMSKSQCQIWTLNFDIHLVFELCHLDFGYLDPSNP